MNGDFDTAFWAGVPELDLRGLKCPLPAIRVQRALERMAAGERIVVRATDPLSEIDVPHAAASLGARVARQACDGRLRSFWIER